MERPGGLDEVDTPPTAGSPDTFFVPWFAPDEPNSPSGYPNNYLSDGAFPSGTSAATKQKSTAKYPGSSVSSTTKAAGYNCKDTEPITPLTNDRALLEDKIDAMVAAYLTHIPMGLAWGWWTLSPGAPYTERRIIFGRRHDQGPSADDGW